ncbi:hypothetical protein GIB67_006098 [Kingdonia uniflora]|uniref:F-box domain-containing protein n=1 Tax=Kingdonia uniflora TaxID=39325 RepID=A0A7J7LPL4_9MAGN|nr:hypothetical protein GIB67_006098 [Kingdonia uniflora]
MEAGNEPESSDLLAQAQPLESYGFDKLSTLPDDILHHIFSTLATVDVVRASMLSTRWVSLWKSISTLSFDVTYCTKTQWLVNFIERVLIQRGESDIHTFRFATYGNKVLDVLCAYAAIDFAVNHNVQHLDLDIDGGVSNYWGLPLSVFTCISLWVLKLSLMPVEDYDMSSLVKLPHLRTLQFVHLKLLCRVEQSEYYI